MKIIFCFLFSIWLTLPALAASAQPRVGGVEVVRANGGLATNMVVRGFTNASATAPVHSVSGYTSGDGTENGFDGYIDVTTGNIFAITVTNVEQSVTNIFVGTWPLVPGWCWQLESTNNYLIRYTNGPCGGSGGAEIWSDDAGVYTIATEGSNVQFYPSLTDPAGAISSNPNYQLHAAGYRSDSFTHTLLSDTNGNLAYFTGGDIPSLVILAQDRAASGAFRARSISLADGSVTLYANSDGHNSLSFLAPGARLLTSIDPAKDTAEPYRFNTLDPLDLDSIHFQGQNADTNIYTFYGDGSFSISGKTNRFSVSAEGLLLKDSAPLTALYGSLANISGAATSAQIDFSPGVGITHYQVTNLAGNLSLQITNLYTDTYGPRDIWIYIETDGTPRDITVSTNGITTGTRVSWGFNSVTNGATSFTATNRVRVNLTRNRAGVVSAAYEHQQ